MVRTSRSLAPEQALVLAGGDDRADDAAEDHEAARPPGGAAAYLRGLADGEHVLEVRVRARDDVHGDQLAHAARGGGAGVGGGLDRGHVAAHQRRDVAGADLLVADERDLGRLHHGVGGLDHGHQAPRLDHPQRFTHAASRSAPRHSDPRRRCQVKPASAPLPPKRSTASAPAAPARAGVSVTVPSPPRGAAAAARRRAAGRADRRRVAGPPARPVGAPRRPPAAGGPARGAA